MKNRVQGELAPKLNDGFDQPKVVDDVLVAFPTANEDLLPPWDSIPTDFQNPNRRTVWNRFVSDWFFNGWPEDRDLYTRPDVDAEAAFRHLSTIMRSWDCKHEHKEAAVSWLMSRWFLDIQPTESEASK